MEVIFDRHGLNLFYSLFNNNNDNNGNSVIIIIIIIIIKII